MTICKHQPAWPKRPTRLSLAATAVLAALTLSACDKLIPQSPAALVKNADARACTHPETLAQVRAVATFADRRPIPADEAAVIGFEMTGGTMLSADPGVSVICEVDLHASYGDRTHDLRFVFYVFPVADTGDVTIRWQERMGNFPTEPYSSAQYDWREARQMARRPVTPASYSPTPQQPQSRAPAFGSTDYLLNEFRTVCDGTNPRGGIDRIRNRKEDPEVRRQFGWGAFKLFVGLWQSEERPITEADVECASAIRDALAEEGLLEGLEEDIQRSRRPG